MTVTVACDSFVFGVILMVVTLAGTLSVYEFVLGENTGFKVPELTVRPLNVASAEAALVTVIV